MTKEDMNDIADRVVDVEDNYVRILNAARTYAASPQTIASRNKFLALVDEVIESEQTAHLQKREPEYYSGDSDEHEEGGVGA